MDSSTTSGEQRCSVCNMSIPHDRFARPGLCRWCEDDVRGEENDHNPEPEEERDDHGDS